MQAIEQRLADGLSERLVSDLTQVRADRTKPRPWLGAAAALLVLPIHLATIAFAGVGVGLIVFGSDWPLRVLGVASFVVAIGTVPHLPRGPKYSAKLLPDKAPALYDLVSSVAEVTGAPMPDEILVDSRLNASVSRVGLRKRVLTLGSPLWVASTPSARVALLGHELGHFAHGDLMRGFWVGTGYETIARWLAVLRSAHGFDALHRVVETIFFLPVRALLASYASLISRINGPAHRRQEYLADLDAARVGGTAGALELLDTMLAWRSVDTAMTRAAVHPDRPDVWQTVRDQIAATPLLEIERRRRAAALESSRIDDGHPNTALRMRLLSSWAVYDAAVRRDAAAWERIDKEMAAGLARSARVVAERIRYAR
jgi:Zn-dependent protease with chaperone function